MSMRAIETIEVTEAAGRTEIEFANIPQTYTDLYLLISSRSSRTGNTNDTLLVNVNSLTSGYTRHIVRGNSSGASGVAATSGSDAIIGYTTANDAAASIYGNTSVYFSGYTDSSAKAYSVKTAGENNGTTAFHGFTVVNQSSTNAIDTISITVGNGNLMQYSSATLYGVTSGSDGIVTVS